MEKYTTGTEQKIYVHDKVDCEARGGHCVIHSPSDHHMKDWPTNWREDRKLMERICKCGVGHPDPDDLAFQVMMAKKWDRPYNHLGVHGCCGCCNHFLFLN